MIRRALAILLLIPTLVGAREKLGTILYDSGSPTTAAEAQWLAERLDYQVTGTTNPIPYNPNIKWFSYKDSSVIYPFESSFGAYPNESVSLKDYAISQGWNYEDCFVHSTVNYEVTTARHHSGLDQFGAWGDEGVWLYSGGAYTNRKTAAYNATAGDVALVDTLYLGYEEPFDRATFIHSTYAVGASFVWEYWNGSTWATLTLADNGTTSFTQNGTMIWTPPANWTTVSVNGTRAQWWVRVRVTSATTKPIWTSVKGDDWKVDPTHARGWDATDSNRVNVGTLVEYNPTPPAGASARFRYQARMVGSWKGRAVYMNQANVQGGVHTTAKWLHYFLGNRIATRGYNAIFLDDVGLGPDGYDINPAPALPFTDVAGVIWANEVNACLDQLVADFAISHPGVLVGGNTYEMVHAFHLGWNMDEQGHWPRAMASSLNARGYYYSASKTAFANYLTPANTLGTIGMTQFNDVADYWEKDGRRAYVDRGNRTPILALAAYLIGRNNFSVFDYHSHSAYSSYPDKDDFYEWADGSVLTQPITASANTSDNTTKTLTVESTTAFPAGNLVIRIGDERIDAGYVGRTCTKATATTLTTNVAFMQAHPPGEMVYYRVRKKQSTDAVTPSRVARWGNYFPAMSVDFGDPDPAGYNGGVAHFNWKSQAQMGGVNGSGGVHRRDFTKAVILARINSDSIAGEQSVFDTPGPSIDLGGTYYPLQASGSTSAAVTAITLRPGEAAILMKAPVDGGTYDPPDPPADTIPPGRSALAPSGVQTCDANPRSLTLSLTTNENATCKYGTVDALYAALPSTFSTTGTTSHSQAVSVPCGASYAYHVRCQDTAGNANTSGSAISFSVAAATPAADAIPPGRILDLAISNRGVATWTETGDDGEDGTASLRELRCKIGSSFVAADWAAGLNLTGLPSVAASMTARTATVQGLVTGSPVTCGMRATDEEGNLGLLGNVVTVTLTPPTGEAARLGSTPLRLLGRPVRFAR
jgi:hypothetical protein